MTPFEEEVERTVETLNSHINTILLKLPILGPLLSLLYAHRFADTMSLLLYAGVPPQSAISASGAATSSPLITTLSQTASNSIAQGTALSSAITTITPISPHDAPIVMVSLSYPYGIVMVSGIP